MFWWRWFRTIEYVIILVVKYDKGKHRSSRLTSRTRSQRTFRVLIYSHIIRCLFLFCHCFILVCFRSVKLRVSLANSTNEYGIHDQVIAALHWMSSLCRLEFKGKWTEKYLSANGDQFSRRLCATERKLSMRQDNRGLLIVFSRKRTRLGEQTIILSNNVTLSGINICDDKLTYRSRRVFPMANSDVAAFSQPVKQQSLMTMVT